MKNPYRHLALVGVLALLTSCRETDRISLPEGGFSRTGEGIHVPITVFCEALDTPFDRENSSKSSHPSTSLKKISDLNYYLFRNGELIRQEYFSRSSDFAVTLPSAKDSYNLYILVNVGERSIDPDTPENRMDTAVHVDYQDRNNYMNTISGKGFPMATTVIGFNADSLPSFPLKRLVHTLYVINDLSSLDKKKMQLSDIRIRNAPRDVFPFAAGSVPSHVFDGDAADIYAGDISNLNNGLPVTLYLLENIQGDLFSNADSWKDKVPENADGDIGMASYIEITGNAQTVTANYSGNKYRAFIGTDERNCNAERSSYTTITNRFVSDYMVKEGWRIEPDKDPVITGKLAFVDTRYTLETAPRPTATGDINSRPFRDVEEVYTQTDFTSVYFIYRSSKDIDYTLSVDKSSLVVPYVSYQTSEIDDNFTALMIDTKMPLSNKGTEVTYEPVTFTITSADGVITDRLVCNVITSYPAIKVKYDNSDRHSRLLMSMNNPLGLKIQTAISVTGTSGFDGTVGEPQGQKIYPMTGLSTITSPFFIYEKNGIAEDRWHQIDCNIISGTWSHNDENSGQLYTVLEELWKPNGYDSSERDYRHAVPKELIINVNLRFETPNSMRLCPRNFSPDSGCKIPLHIVNTPLTMLSDKSYTGGGTDFGIEFDFKTFEESRFTDHCRFIYNSNSPTHYNRTYKNGSYTYDVAVKASFISKEYWNSTSLKFTTSEFYDRDHFSNYGFPIF